jgi:hypothetical protein
MSEIHKFKNFNFSEKSIAVHMWNYSFGDPFSRFLIRSGTHSYLKVLLNFFYLDKSARYIKQKIGGVNVLK